MLIFDSLSNEGRIYKLNYIYNFLIKIARLLVEKCQNSRVGRILVKEGGKMEGKRELTQIVKTVQNDMEQFEVLYSHIVNKVNYWCYSIVNDETLAKDLTQEAMIRIYQKLHTLNNVETFNSWMYVLVRNICYSHLHLNKKADISFIESEEYFADFADTIEEAKIENLPEEAYNLKETKQLIVSFVEALPRKQKEVIVLYYLEEFTTQEIAEMLNCNIVTVRSNLRNGRNNLEKLITEYQEKNNTKLYSTILLPLLGALLQKRSEELGDKQDFEFSANNYNKKSLFSYLKNALHINIFSAGSVTMVVLVIIMVVLLVQSKNNSIAGGAELINIKSLVTDLEMLKKAESSFYVESITYPTFPTRNSASVLINLKKDLSEQTIEILFGNQEIPFDIKDKVISVTAKQNGEYTITINGKKTTFLVNTINQYAPEVTGIREYENYLQLYVNDELEQINYQKSFLLYENKKYQITSDNQVLGSFKGNIVVYIFNDLDQYIYYEFYLK